MSEVVSRVVFVDSVFWIALLSPRDSLHQQVVALAETLSETSLITTQEVLVEVQNYFSRRGPGLRQAAVDLIESLSERHNLLVIHPSSELFQEGLKLYRERSDKSYSGTDCISMIVMKQMDIGVALTDDAHFVQQGFEVVVETIASRR